MKGDKDITQEDRSQHPHEVGPTITYPLLVWKHERSESNKNTSFMGML